MELKEEFFKKFTDGIDKENGYYDSQFEGEQPHKLWQWIRQKLIDAKIEEDEWWFQMAGGENGRFIEYGSKDFQHRITELKQQKEK